jgi:hypothetical protein
LGEVIEMDGRSADACAKAGYVKILPSEAAETGDAGDDGQGDAGTDLPSPKGSGEASAGAPSKTSGKQKGK